MLPLVALLATAAPAAGQVRASLDVGAGSYRPDGALTAAVASLAPSFRLDAGFLRFDAAGTYTDAPAGRWNFQGASQLVIRSPRLWFMRAELAGTADWTSHRRVDGTTVLGAEGRIYLHPIRGTSLWAGHTRGLAWSLGQQTPVKRSEAGASAGRGRLQVGVTLASTSFDSPGADDRIAGFAPAVDGLAADTASPPTGPRRGERAGFTDAMLWGRWNHRAFDVDLAIGRRFSRSSPEVVLWSVSAARTILPNLAIVAAAGRAGSDPVTALPGSRYAVLGFRVAVGSPSMREREDDPRPPPPRPGFRIGPQEAAGREIVVRAREALVVEIAGDFTDWRPMALASIGDDEWRIVLPLEPGLHRAVVRSDGGQWQAPPGVRAVHGEFGTQVGEFVVE
ncbi:MAG TPA: glycogen-binding domain-containing protein [Gemmatimonadales bacterium]|nr:glycogen-binding domain-containing protein [Gemmatimonadales bacterium]